MYRESNSRVELVVNMAKRLIKDNTRRGRDLNTNEVMRALLQYLNTPLRGVSSHLVYW